MRPRRRPLRRILLSLLVVLVVALTGGYLYAKPLLLTGTGYAAHNACALQGYAGRSDADTDLPPNPLVPYLRTSVSSDRSQVTTTVLGVLASQTAYYSPAGCTLGQRSTDPLVAQGDSAVSSAPNPFTSAATPSPNATLDALLAKAFGDDLAPADKTKLGTRGIVVIRGGKLIAERYAPGFTAQTPQLGWSMAKSVTSLLVGRLAQQGKVSVTDAALRPEWTDDRAKITLDELMRMTSGLAWNEEYDLGTPITKMLYTENDMGAYAASQPLAHAPGTYQQYSSGSTNIICSILKARTGTGSALPRQQIFEPLGLSSAVWEGDVSGTPVCSSYLWATPRDWATIGQFALQGGEWSGQQLLPVEWMKTTTTVLPGQGEEVGYAAGWWANKLPDGTLADAALPADAYSAEGHDGQRVVVVPSADLVVVRLGFSPSVKGDAMRVSQLVHDLAALPMD